MKQYRFIGPYIIPIERRPLIADIQSAVARYYRIPRMEMVSARRSREVARPRQIAMYLSKQLTTRSLPSIGERFGHRDHTTVIHAIKTIHRLRQGDYEMDRDINILTHGLMA